jgi:nitrite reductase/ring-hydroxylating ferredoxin subunit
MFFHHNSIPVWLSCTRKERRMPEGFVMNTFRLLNWAAGALFLSSSAVFMTTLRQEAAGSRSAFIVVLQQPLTALAMSVSLLYLLLFFGVSVALGALQDRERAALLPSTGSHPLQTAEDDNQLRVAAAAEGLTHRNPNQTSAKSELLDTDQKAAPTDGSGLVRTQPPVTTCRRAVWLADWVFVSAVALVVSAAPLISLYGVVVSFASGQASLAAASQAAPEWAMPFVPAPNSLPWVIAFAAMAFVVIREASARRQLQAKLDMFATNDKGSFDESSSVSASAIAGTNLMLEMDAERERLETYTAEYPTGWYKLCDASELAPGDVKYVRCLGLHLAVFRGKDSGTVSALDAFCPHLGANLALGGKVEGDCLKCPFHEWQFDTSGTVKAIPYTSGVLPKAGAVRYPTTEYAGMVLVFYDADQVKYNDLSKQSGQNACKDGAYSPKYQPPAMPELADGRMTLRGSFKARVVNMPLVEFVLNAVDQAHFACLHSEMLIPWT